MCYLLCFTLTSEYVLQPLDVWSIVLFMIFELLTKALIAKIFVFKSAFAML